MWNILYKHSFYNLCENFTTVVLFIYIVDKEVIEKSAKYSVKQITRLESRMEWQVHFYPMNKYISFLFFFCGYYLTSENKMIWTDKTW